MKHNNNKFEKWQGEEIVLESSFFVWINWYLEQEVDNYAKFYTAPYFYPSFSALKELSFGEILQLRLTLL